MLIEQLKECAVTDSEIGIITPYNAQVQQLRKRLSPTTKAEVSTVDGFQGREKEVIIISMVRSNPEHKVGFLSDQRRMNVAITRAKTFVGIICDSSTVSSNSFLKGIVEYVMKNGQVIHAKEYSAEPEFQFSTGVFASKKESKPKAKKPKKKPNKVQVKESKDALAEEIQSPSEDNEEKEKLNGLYKEIDEFIQSDKKTFEMSEKLTSYYRMQIHKYISDNYKNVQHTAEGIEPHRRVILRKNPQEDIKESPLKNETKVSDSERQIPKEEKVKPIKKKAKKQKKNQEKKSDNDEDIDDILNKMIEDNTTCNMIDEGGTRCTKTTEIFGRVCPHCAKRYCLEHLGLRVHKCPMNVKPEKVVRVDPASLKAAVNQKLFSLKATRTRKTKKK